MYRCSPLQLRRCSLREIAEEEAAADRPWTFEKNFSEIEQSDCTDLTGQEDPPAELMEDTISEEEFEPDEQQDDVRQMDSDEEMIPVSKGRWTGPRRDLGSA